MAPRMDPFKVLGVAKDAGLDEIKAAYRSMAQKYHPDSGGDAWVFQQICEAYDHLRQQQEPSATSQVTDRGVETEVAAAQSGSASSAGPPPSPASSASAAPLGTLRDLLSKQLPLQNETTYFILVSVLDIFLTYLLLRSGGAEEANPLAAFFLNHWGFRGMIAFKMVAVAAVSVLAQTIALKSLPHARSVLYAGIVISGLVVAYSLFLLSKTI